MTRWTTFALFLVCMSPLVGQADYPSTILQDNPLAYYRFEEPAGSEETADSSGNGLDSIEVNLANFGIDGVCGGKAVEFEGDGSIVVGLDVDPDDPKGDGSDGDFTIETWVLTTSERDQQVYVSQKDGTTGPGRSDMLISANLQLGSFIGGATTDSGVMPVLDTWYHFVMAIDGADDELYFYVDGEPSEDNPQFAGANGVEPANGNWVIGSHKGQAIQFFEGLVDEVAFYDYRLDDPNGDNDTSDSRIAAHVAACSAPPAVPGDYDGDGNLTAADIDRLTTAVRDGLMDAPFDVNTDGAVNDADRLHWVNVLKNTYLGDSNLDGEFNSSDFVQVFQIGQYEDGRPANSTWGGGDWNGDGEFSSSDFVAAFQAGAYEIGPRPPAAQVVPEPTAYWLLLFGLIAVMVPYRRCCC